MAARTATATPTTRKTRTATNSLPKKIEAAVETVAPKKRATTANTSKPRDKKIAAGRVEKKTAPATKKAPAAKKAAPATKKATPVKKPAAATTTTTTTTTTKKKKSPAAKAEREVETEVNKVETKAKKAAKVSFHPTEEVIFLQNTTLTRDV
ncbi:hypothetical protein PMIN05_010428 [Paraphaeosphaeria minitans]